MCWVVVVFFDLGILINVIKEWFLICFKIFGKLCIFINILLLFFYLEVFFLIIVENVNKGLFDNVLILKFNYNFSNDMLYFNY